MDEQREHRLLREGLFWHDERLDGLSDDDRMWEIIKMSFLQVAKVLDSVGCVQYFEYFLGRGIMGAKHLRLLTVKYVETKMPRIKDPTEREAIVAAAARWVCRPLLGVKGRPKRKPRFFAGFPILKHMQVHAGRGDALL